MHRPQPIPCLIVVSIPACHAGDPGSIPGPGVLFLLVTPSKKVQALGLETRITRIKTLGANQLYYRTTPAPKLLLCVRHPLLAYVHVHTGGVQEQATKERLRWERRKKLETLAA